MQRAKQKRHCCHTWEVKSMVAVVVAAVAMVAVAALAHFVDAAAVVAAGNDTEPLVAAESCSLFEVEEGVVECSCWCCPTWAQQHQRKEQQHQTSLLVVADERAFQ